MTTNIPTNRDDIIDSRDIIEAIEYYRDLHEENPENLSDEDYEHYGALCALARDGESFDEWEYGCTLIRDSYFKKYAMDLAEDIGAIDSNATWPNTCIDWDQAAWELRMDYSAIEFSGVTYLIR